MTNIPDLEPLDEYEQAFKAISILRADEMISGYMYEILWQALETKRASDKFYGERVKKMLQKNG